MSFSGGRRRGAPLRDRAGWSTLTALNRVFPSAEDGEPSLDDFAAIAEEALTEIPPEFKRHIEGVALRIDDVPDGATLRQMRIPHPLGLLGLYRGLPVGFKQAGGVVRDVDMIFLYRQPILAFWRSRGGRLQDVIRHVLVHEIGHHFGLSDDDMERIEEEG
jgi:predicted Zn-dependent protease with MMP-like domain